MDSKTTAEISPPEFQKTFTRVLTEEEDQILMRWRKANLLAEEDQRVTINIYTGSKLNGEKLLEICDLMRRLDAYAPDMPIEAFLVPIPDDPQAASVLKQTMIDNVRNVFEKNLLDPSDFD